VPGGTSHRHAAYRRVLAERSTLSISTTHVIRAFALATLVALGGIAATATASPASASTYVPNTGARVARIALNQRGDQYVFGAMGPSRFDCSGLVRYAYLHAGVGSRIGGGHSARGMYLWGRRHHLTSRTHPRVGDVVVYGRGSHVGIYIGRGRVIHALNRRRDIVVTSLHGISTPFTTFIHTHIPHG
jgi:cell wall-associated NlpC family hydrolase